MPDSTFPGRISHWTAVALLLGMPVLLMPRAGATNLFSVYAGAAYARSNLRAKDSNPIPFSGSGPLNGFSRSDSGYQLTLGVRGLELLGAEFDYFDLGSGGVSNPYDSLGNPGTVSNAALGQKGEVLFAMLYLPVPMVDVYLKAGVGRITSDLSARFVPQAICPIPAGAPNPCAPESLALHTTTTGLAVGAGAQWKFGNWALRAEYERFTALGEHPDLVSVGVIWTFL